METQAHMENIAINLDECQTAGQVRDKLADLLDVSLLDADNFETSDRAASTGQFSCGPNGDDRHFEISVREIVYAKA